MVDGAIASTVAVNKYGQHMPVYPKWVTEALKAKPIHRSQLPEVTPTEHAWLMANGYPNVAKWTRMPGEVDDWLDTEPFVASRYPVVKEILVGARSLGCVASDSDEESIGLALSQEEQEDTKEVTDLLTLTYQDAPAFDRWLKQRTDDCLIRHGFKLNNIGMRKRIMDAICTEVPCDSGEPLKCMIEDPKTGEYRPLKIGDTVEIAWGSNEDLDALFLEEGDDPRKQNDVTALGDHRWSDSFREPTDLEYGFHHASRSTQFKPSRWVADLRKTEFIGPRRRQYSKDPDRHIIANAALDDVRWSPSPKVLRRLAEQNVERIIKRNPALADQAYALTKEVEQKLTAMAKDVRFDHEAGLIEGHFITGSEYFGTLDRNRQLYEQEVLDQNGNRKPGARPKAVDFDALRKPEENRRRFLEQHRNRLKAQLVPQPVAKTHRH